LKGGDPGIAGARKTPPGGRGVLMGLGGVDRGG
jgi:hypothetical protein